MTHRIGRPLILTAMAGLLAACAIDLGDEGNFSDADAVRQNSRLAEEQCGPGRVASVGKDGYTCTGSTE